METIGARIMHVRKEIAKMSQTEFGDLFGVHHVTISGIEKAKSKPTPEQLVLIRQKFNVSTDWILTGEGSMILGEPIAAKPTDWREETLTNLKKENAQLWETLKMLLGKQPVEAAQLGKVKGNRQPVGLHTIKPAFMNVVKTIEHTKTVTHANVNALGA